MMTARDLGGARKLPADKPNEFHCPRCGARCTRTLNHGEVGHKIGCPRRPEGLPTSGIGGGSYYRGDA
jgi:hypothetical protein